MLMKMSHIINYPHSVYYIIEVLTVAGSTSLKPCVSGPGEAGPRMGRGEGGRGKGARGRGNCGNRRLLGSTFTLPGLGRGSLGGESGSASSPALHVSLKVSRNFTVYAEEAPVVAFYSDK